MSMQRDTLVRLLVFVAVFVAVLALTLSACNRDPDQSSSPVSPAGSSMVAGQQIKLSKSDSRVLAAIRVQEKHTQRLMSVRDVVGTAVGLDNAGEVVVKIYTVREGVADLPKTLDGMKVDVEVTGIIRAMAKPDRGGVSHTAKQSPPVQLGTSGGWHNDLANGYCCSGTLGALVRTGSGNNLTLYVLSNYHVLESDIVTGGNGFIAATGDAVIQPGLVDVNCSAADAQHIATLVKTSSLPGTNVDAAIAQVIPGMVNSTGSILEIGTIAAGTTSAFINQAVKKSGRTTGLSRSKITGLNATLSVLYDNECAGGTAFTKTFTGQIVAANRGSRFLNSGDSGSLMVEDAATSPHAVGLLFAGSSTVAIANPIDDVLTFLGGKLNAPVSMVGN